MFRFILWFINTSLFMYSKKKMIRYIDDNIQDVDMDTRRYILNIIASSIGPSAVNDVIYEEGTVCRILYSNINDITLDEIMEAIKKNIPKYRLNDVDD